MVALYSKRANQRGKQKEEKLLDWLLLLHSSSLSSSSSLSLPIYSVVETQWCVILKIRSFLMILK